MRFRLRLTLRLVRLVVIALILMVAGGGVGYYYGRGEFEVEVEKSVPKIVVNTEAPEEFEEVDFSLFWEVWAKLRAEYLDSEKLDEDKMVWGAIRGMVASLGDPYTVFLPPEEQKRTTEDLSGAFAGVGIQLGYIRNNLAVIAPLKGMPAEAQGVRAGDLILNIKDESKGIDIDTGGMSLPEAVSHIRGELGVPVTLSLFRESNGVLPFEVEIVRDEIVIPTVELEFVDDGRGGVVARLILSRFGERTEVEWNVAVDEIVERSDVRGVVLDLRNNPGGFLNGAIFIASEFVDSGVVVKQQGKFNTETFSVNRQGRLTKIPVVVLMNRGSASASEIVAGALRDRLDAKLVGEQSFGKGTVQNAEELREGTGIHVTVARWLLPKGDWIHDDGLEPDVVASNSAETVDVDETLERAVEELGG